MDKNVLELLYETKPIGPFRHSWARGYGKTVHLWEYGGQPSGQSTASAYVFYYEVFQSPLSIDDIDQRTLDAKDPSRQKRHGSASHVHLPEEHAERNELASKFLSREDEDYPALIKELGGSPHPSCS